MGAVVVADRIRIPSGLDTLKAFRGGARVEGDALRGWVWLLDGEIWVDTNMEQLFTHNRVKTRYANTLDALVEQEESGYYFADRVLLTHPEANLSTEPDGTFVSFDALESERIRFVKGVSEGFVEMEGTPDMALEVVSTFAVRKDTDILRDLYWRARIPEYWLVDVRKTPVRFDILRWTSRGYAATRRQDGWIRSNVFGKAFLLETGTDRLGNPTYRLCVKD